MSYRTLISAVGMGALLGISVGAHAQFADMRQRPTLYMQGGVAEHGAKSLAIGSTLPMRWYSNWSGYPVTAHWDMSLALWNAEHEYSDNKRNIAVLGLTPTLRLHSRSTYPWFVEAGIGGYVSNHLYESRDKRFSTAFNFGSHLGLGFFTGRQRENEWMLRVEHISNGGIKKPNPGENFIQLRYARHF
ncbi:MAG: acyloxyacyl hydrolase [Comamonas sp.]